MRCLECGAQSAEAALVCSRCGAPIVGQPTVVADTVVADRVVADTVVADTVVADTVVDVVGDAAGKAVPAGAAAQALPEPYVPGSGDRLPAELRQVLAGYIAIACGLFAGALACAAVAVFVFFGYAVNYDLGDDGAGLFFVLAYFVVMAWIVGLLDALQARIRFSRLLRRPSDPRTATVTASKRGGGTVILDIIPRDGTRRGYRPLSEVRLALWTKAGMLVPGETVKIYAEHRPAHMGPGGSGKRPLLVSSPQRGRAFLGTMESRSTLQPGSVTPRDEKVSGATVVDWAEWADSTTFSKHNWRRRGYEPIEVDAFLDAIRDTFLGVSTPPVRSDDLRGKQFSTHRPGYDKTQVDAFLDAAGIRLVAMESTDKPQGPLASGAILADWAEWADSTRFSPTAFFQGYARAEVDAFREELRDTFLGVRQPPVVSSHVRSKRFSTHRPRYGTQQVSAFIEKAAWRLAAMESTDTPQGPLVSWILAEWAEWAEWADSTRFETTRRLGEAYDAAEVDAFRKEIRDTLLGVRQPPLTSHAVHGKQFTPTRGRGYDVQQVDAFLDQAELRLAAMLP
jgi:DivIVA domain-containing protein